MCKLSLLPLVLALATAQQDGLLLCQPTWTNGQPVVLSFILNKFDFSVKCPGTSTGRAEFQQSATGQPGTFITQCSAPDIRTSSCNYQLDSSSPGCGCVLDNGTYVIEYLFIAEASKNGWWTVIMTCFDLVGNNPLVLTSSGCDNKITIPTTTPPPTTAPATEASTTQRHENKGLNEGQKAAIGTAVVVVIIFVTCILLFLWPKKSWRVLVDPKKHLCEEELIRKAKQFIDMEQPGYAYRPKKIEKEAVCGCGHCAVTLTVGGNNSIDKDGRPVKDETYGLHVLVTCRNIIFLCRAVTQVKKLVNEMNPGSYGPSGKGGGHEAKPSSKSSVIYQNSSATNGAKTEARVNPTRDDSRTAADGESQHKASTPDTS